MYKIFDLDKNFILENIKSLIELEDYVPFDFRVYGFQKERDDFLESKSLLRTMREMDSLLDEKCKHYKNPLNARNSIMIEWLDLHPEFTQILSDESYIHYQNIKSNGDFVPFLDLLYFKVPSEKVNIEYTIFEEGISFKDDSKIRLPNFDKMDEMYDKYPHTILADYLAYIV